MKEGGEQRGENLVTRKEVEERGREGEEEEEIKRKGSEEDSAKVEKEREGKDAES